MKIGNGFPSARVILTPPTRSSGRKAPVNYPIGLPDRFSTKGLRAICLHPLNRTNRSTQERRNALPWLVRKADMPSPKLTNEIIIAAITGFESQKRRIDGQIADLRAMLPGGTADPAATPESPTIKRRKFSAAARRRMKEAQQLRWAKIRGESSVPSSPPATPEPAKPKRKLSKAGKAAIVGSKNAGRRRRRRQADSQR